MSCKKELLRQVDELIINYGDNHPQLVRDLQKHRDAVANALNKKDLIQAMSIMATVARFLKDIWPD